MINPARAYPADPPTDAFIRKVLPSGFCPETPAVAFLPEQDILRLDLCGFTHGKTIIYELRQKTDLLNRADLQWTVQPKAVYDLANVVISVVEKRY